VALSEVDLGFEEEEFQAPLLKAHADFAFEEAGKGSTADAEVGGAEIETGRDVWATL
jgi:hypothetical protein